MNTNLHHKHIIKTFSEEHGFKIDKIEVLTPNKIIFKQTASKSFSFLEEEGKFYLLDIKANKATELTPEVVAKQAVKDFKKGKVTNFTTYTELMGFIESIEFGKDKDIEPKKVLTTVSSICNQLNMEVVDVKVAVQNEVIFNKFAIPIINDLVKDGKNYYQLDVANNIAKIIDPEVIAAQAEKDLKEQRFNTDAVHVAEQFWLIQELKLVRKES